MQLDIITPEKKLFSATASHVMVPGSMGDFGVLPGHAPFISTLRDGVVIIDQQGANQQRFAVSGGLTEANPDSCIILAEAALECTTLTMHSINEQRQAINAQLESTKIPADRQALHTRLALLTAAETIAA